MRAGPRHHVLVGAIPVAGPGAGSALSHDKIVELLVVRLDEQGPVLPKLLLVTDTDVNDAFVLDAEIVRTG